MFVYNIAKAQKPEEMTKSFLVPLICSLVVTMPCFKSINAETNWAKSLQAENQKETVTTLQFYFHDIVSGKNPTAIKVAESTETKNSPTLFGAIMMADDPLTEGPDPSSRLVGRAQGLYGSACKDELGLIMAMNFGFLDGMYNGSSISLLGKNKAMNPTREMPIVGGTGLFRFARGYAVAKTHWMDITTGDAIVAYNVTVVH